MTDRKPSVALLLLASVPLIGFVVIMGLGAISRVDYALGMLVMVLILLAYDALERAIGRCGAGRRGA